ncbi:histidine phosphatase family protein, partial [Pseudomonas fragi]|nr:histidine phosphatase family protein [Pseudomonas sp. GC01]
MTKAVWNTPRLKPYLLGVIPALLVAGAITLAVHADKVFAQPIDGVQTLVFMRHAEKPADGLGQLNCQGLNRAIALWQQGRQIYGT